MSKTVNGVLALVKPSGLTSHDVVNRVRRLSGIRRIGHTGTLDPLADGLLILCVGRATRLAEYIVGHNKTYEATIRLGQETATYDSEGVITSERPVNVSDDHLFSALDHFRGQIDQVPPMFSAVKIKGKPLYHHARLGQEIERPARRVTISELEILEWRTPILRLRIFCSSGTYIRSIAHDLGQTLSCGAHLTRLTRTGIGKFTVKEAVPLSDLDQENWKSQLQSLDTAVLHLPKLVVSIVDANLLAMGQKISYCPGQILTSPARAYDIDDRFIGLVNLIDGQWKPHKIFITPQSGRSET